VKISRFLLRALLVGVPLIIGWVYYQSLVPAIHPDHDHGLENLAGGGFLRVDAVEGGRRNLVGRPGKVLILHWFELDSRAGVSDLPLLVDYARTVASDPMVEAVLVATGAQRERVLAWARDHAVPTRNLYVDPGRRTVKLIGVRRIPETLIYDAEGHLVHQARGPMNWGDPGVRAMIEGLKEGRAGTHQH
jgi:hypothetical protein